MNIEEIIRDNKKPLVIILIFCILLLILWGINNIKSKEEIIRDYIIQKDFTIDKDKILYKKILSNITKDDYDENVKNKIESEFDVLYFDIYNYQLNENLYKYKDETELFLTANYDYTNDSISYNYKVTYKTANIIFRGNYKKNKFTCNNEYAFDAYIEGTKDDYCNNIKIEIEDFKNKAIETITSTRILNYMKN